jgi:nitrite reductase/ring-hydroxylating ferredoxin subunit/DMSO/TMAO reductase YedYZ heme-binding membrane subunit
MSARFVPVGWNRAKYVYDAVVLVAVVGYLLLYLWVGPSLETGTKPIDDQTLAMRAWGTCAFLMLSVVLAIGPLCRLDSRFLPLLYNRRHFGVITCAVAAGHVSAVLGWYFAYSATPVPEAVLGADTSFLQFSGFPFIPFGIAGFIVLCALAATSHDFWLAFLTPPVWKALHMAIYPAYASIVLHVTLGALQSARDPLLGQIVMASVVALAALHVGAALRERRRDRSVASSAATAGWVVAADVADIAESQGIVVHLADDEPVAIFRHDGRLSAVSNLCAHQNGPLGEGRVVGGCITCPWHGFQYRLEDGCAPPPYTEKLATYNLRLEGTKILLERKANPPGTPVPSLPISVEAP